MRQIHPLRSQRSVVMIRSDHQSRTHLPHDLARYCCQMENNLSHWEIRWSEQNLSYLTCWYHLYRSTVAHRSIIPIYVLNIFLAPKFKSWNIRNNFDHSRHIFYLLLKSKTHFLVSFLESFSFVLWKRFTTKFWGHGIILCFQAVTTAPFFAGVAQYELPESKNRIVTLTPLRKFSKRQNRYNHVAEKHSYGESSSSSKEHVITDSLRALLTLFRRSQPSAIVACAYPFDRSKRISDDYSWRHRVLSAKFQ